MWDIYWLQSDYKAMHSHNCRSMYSCNHLAASFSKTPVAYEFSIWFQCHILRHMTHRDKFQANPYLLRDAYLLQFTALLRIILVSLLTEWAFFHLKQAVSHSKCFLFVNIFFEINWAAISIEISTIPHKCPLLPHCRGRQELRRKRLASDTRSFWRMWWRENQSQGARSVFSSSPKYPSTSRGYSL